MPKCDKYHAKWKANMAKCSKCHAKCKVTMPKFSKYHAKWQILVPNCCKHKANGTKKERKPNKNPKPEPKEIQKLFWTHMLLRNVEYCTWRKKVLRGQASFVPGTIAINCSFIPGFVDFPQWWLGGQPLIAAGLHFIVIWSYLSCSLRSYRAVEDFWNHRCGGQRSWF